MGKPTPIETLALSPLSPDALRGLHLIYGHPMAREVGFYLTAAWLCQGHRAVVVDGENRFDPFVFSDAARRVARSPDRLLRNLFVSRAFTCHQLQALIVGRLIPAIRETHSRLILVVGLLASFYDEQVPQWEAERLLRPTLGRLYGLAKRGYGVLVLLPGEPSAKAGRKIFLEWTKACADRVIRVEPLNPYELTLHLEKPAGEVEDRRIRFDPAMCPQRQRRGQP